MTTADPVPASHPADPGDGVEAPTDDLLVAPPPPLAPVVAPASVVEPVLVAGVVTGVLIALAPALPTPIRMVALALATPAWLVVIVVSAVQFVRRGSWWRPAARAVGLVGLVLAVVRATELGWVRIVRQQPALLWNVDWRYSLTQAQGIARFGGLDHSLDYAGAPVAYHVGPSWLGGAFNHVFGGGLETILFIVVPAVAVVTTFGAGVAVLRAVGARADVGILTSGVVMSLSFLGTSGFSVELIQNGMLGMAVGLSGAALVLTARRPWTIAVGALGLGSLVATKPQYAIGVFGVLAVVAAWLVMTHGWRGRARSVTLGLAGGAVALLVLLPWQPHEATFSSVRFALIDRTGLAGLVRDPTVPLAVGALVVAFLAHRITGQAWARVTAPLVATLAAYLVMWLANDNLEFLLSDALVDRAHAVGLDFSATLFDRDVGQALVIAGYLVTLLAVGLLVDIGLRLPGIAPRAVLVVAAVVVLVPVPGMIRAAADPVGSAGYESTNDADLRHVVSQLPSDHAVLISSDLADEAGDDARPLRGVGLTAFGPQQYFVSNIAYGNWTDDTAAARLDDLHAFFDTPWSAWHDWFLAANGITDILVDDRCPPAWLASSPLRPTIADGRWTVYRVPPASSTPGDGVDEAATGAPPAPAAVTPPPPRYGLAPCQ